MSMYETVAGVGRSEVPVVPEEEDDEDGRRVFKNNRRWETARRSKKWKCVQYNKDSSTFDTAIRVLYY